MRSRESAAALGCLRALRLTRHAQSGQRTATRATGTHLWGGGDEPKKPWQV